MKLEIGLHCIYENVKEIASDRRWKDSWWKKNVNFPTCPVTMIPYSTQQFWMLKNFHPKYLKILKMFNLEKLVEIYGGHFLVEWT